MTTQKEVQDAIAELQEAMQENLEAQLADTNIKLKKIKAQKRLSLARDSVRNIQFN